LRWAPFRRRRGGTCNSSRVGGNACTEEEVVIAVPLAVVTPDGQIISQTVANEGPEVSLV